jgi:2-methylcitrate dehydratase PrpD
MTNHAMAQDASSPFISDDTRQLAAYIVGAGFEQTPEDVLEKARHHLLDTLAAMVSGSRLRAGVLASAYLASMGGRGSCNVAGTRLQTSAVDAALANGMMAHGDETDDSHLGGRFHPGCGIVPCVLAAAQLKPANGLAMLRALALGYDVGARFNVSLGPRKLYAGGHSTHSVGPLFGGAAAAASLLHLNEEQVRYVLAYTVQQASGVQCWSRDEHHVEKAFDFGGMPARNAMASATMVSNGFTGVPDALAGPNNFFSAFSTDPRPKELVSELGSRYEILQATIKKWCVGSPIQGAIDAVLALMKDHGLTASNLQQLVIELPDDRCQLVNNRHMPNINVQHLVALTLVDGGLNFESSHDHGRMLDPAVLSVKSKIDLQPNESLTSALPPRQVIISATTHDGREIRHHAKAVRGTPDDPMTRAEVIEKAIDLMAPILGTAQATELTQEVMKLDKVNNAGARIGALISADPA